MRTTQLLLSLLLLLPESSSGFGVLPELHAALPVAKELVHGALASYQHALHTDALKTQVETGIALAVVGDAIAQKTQSAGDAQYDAKRALSFASFDGVYRAAQHFLYPPLIALCHGQILGALLPNQQHFAAAMEQSLISQIVVIPIVYYPVFFAVTGAVQGLTIAETFNRAKDSFWPLMTRNWLFWIPVQFAVFGFVPDEDAQISILIASGLVWTVILSALAGAATPKERYNEPAENLLTSPEQEMQRSFGTRAYEEALETPEGRALSSSSQLRDGRSK